MKIRIIVENVNSVGSPFLMKGRSDSPTETTKARPECKQAYERKIRKRKGVSKADSFTVSEKYTLHFYVRVFPLHCVSSNPFVL